MRHALESARKQRLRSLRKRLGLLNRTIELLEKLQQQQLPKPVRQFSTDESGVLFLEVERDLNTPACCTQACASQRGQIIAFPKPQ